jgi:outer membrane receptor protein involved in Fe transport
MQVTGADFNVSARGDNQLFANKILVMVDGRSIYIDGQGLVFWKSLPVTLPEIKRIEVLKGPASVVYGFNAFDGVINIITKSAQDMKGTTLQFGGGELGTISSAAVQAGSAGKLDYRLSIGHDQNQQWRNHDALAFRSNKFNVQTQYNFSGDATLRVAGGFIDTNRFDGPVSNVQIPRSQFNQGLYGRALPVPQFLRARLVAGQRHPRRLRHTPAALAICPADERDGRVQCVFHHEHL